MMTRKLSLIFAILAISALAACKSTSSLNTKGAQGGSNSASADNSLGVSSLQGSGSTALSSVLPAAIYFDFDSYAVQDSYQSLLQRVHERLISDRAGRVLLQGNTDERGTSEYNLALGQKRAEAVRRELSTLGVSNSQMEAVSLGEEKPHALGHDEAAWRENRRVDLLPQ